MNIEDKLPKAEDVVKEYLDKSYTIDEIKTSVHIIKAMHEYARRLLDIVAEEAAEQNENLDTTRVSASSSNWIITNQWNKGQWIRINKDEILKFKEMLK